MKRVSLLVAGAVAAGFLFAVVLLYSELHRGGSEVLRRRDRAAMRRLLGVGEPAVTEQMGGDACSKDNIVVYQGATAPLPNGIPTYTVQILNVCMASPPAEGGGGGGRSCAVSDIHVSCGWFSSARLINPRVFRRVRFDDCLVNDGAALGPGESLSFQYANTYPYQLYVSSVSCY